MLLGGVEVSGTGSGSMSDSVPAELHDNLRSVPSNLGGACSELKELTLSRRSPADLLRPGFPVLPVIIESASLSSAVSEEMSSSPSKIPPVP